MTAAGPTGLQTAAGLGTADGLLTADELEAALRDIGRPRYHNLHPFHRLLHGGKLSRDQVRAWALNRYYYQAMIPIKDATLLARMEEPRCAGSGASASSIMTATARAMAASSAGCGSTDSLDLPRSYVDLDARPAAGDALRRRRLCRLRPRPDLLEAIASSLTEMFRPMIISERVAGMLADYDFVSRDTLAYFDKRLSQAPRDADFALDYVKRHATTPAMQQAVLDALRFKCDVLWSQLDALDHAYVTPGLPPPGAWSPARRRPRDQPRPPPRCRGCRAA